MILLPGSIASRGRGIVQLSLLLLSAWQPRHLRASITIGLGVLVWGAVNSHAQARPGPTSTSSAPIISVNGIVNAAAFLPAAPVAPGSIISIYGANFTQVTSHNGITASDSPLPRT